MTLMKHSAGQTNSYTYDAENRMASVTAPGGVVTTYVYGADGKRVEKQTSSGNTYYDYDFDGSLVAIYTLAGTTLSAATEDFWLNGDHLGFFTGTSNIYRSQLDWVGSVRTRIDPSSNIISADRNLPFGEMQTEYLPNMATWGDQYDTIHFTGKERDAESGLDYFGARYYSSSTGRFLSPDPSSLYFANPTNPQSLNLYSYAQNNPLKNTDPSGLDCLYFNEAGNGLDSNGGIDRDNSSESLNQQAADCSANGGAYVNGTVNAASLRYNSETDDFTVQSSDSSYQYNTTVTATGPNSFYGTNITDGVIDQSRTPLPQPSPGFTVQLGLSGNFGIFGPLTGTVFVGLVIESHGGVAAYKGGGGGLSGGAGASAGLQLGVSNGNSVCAFGGPFANVSFTGGAGGGGTADFFAGAGDGPGGVVSGGSITAGIAGGASPSATVTTTYITPFGGARCD